MRVRFTGGDVPGEAWAEVGGDTAEPLSRIVPLLETVGFVVLDHETPGEPATRRFLLRGEDGVWDGDLERRLAETVEACAAGRCEVDALNVLVRRAGLSWTEVAVLRAYVRYQSRLRVTPGGEVVEQALLAHPHIAASLLACFRARVEGRGDAAAELGARVRAACDDVPRLDHDEALRRVLTLVEATVASNAPLVAASGGAGPLALKLDSARVPGLPVPVPYREISVLSPRLEGVHLRGGRVARGGLRWSERPEDLRDEVLGLVKAQMLKNALIVPTGAKGGFVVRRGAGEPPPTPEEVREAYRAFVGALLDVTGEDDPYLVVAADKGTAAFSDLANEVALERDFWLGDAFASGGSSGYDHKGLGITARGAWRAAERHFLELDMRPGVDPITAVGIGDMSGDVFGNGMVAVEGLRLIAAFDHRDVFVDPDPDPVVSLAERRRLQALPRSSWQDYDRALLSPGGEVYSRSAKRVELSAQARAALRVEEESLTPAELIRAILRAPVDLLFAGGVGTYVKARGERDVEIGDRANDAVRIHADELRARVYCEGANLSITQAARSQYARRGGRVNQDAIDNAAGVAISDREVNLKILLRDVGPEERAALLAAVTDQTVAAVLDDVALQSLCLSAAQQTARGIERSYERVMLALEAAGGLDREAELLPSSEVMRERAETGAGMVRPELATLLAHAKRRLTAAVLDSPLPDEPALGVELRRYFPSAVLERVGDAVERHPLRRELIATRVANDLVNRLGIVFAFDTAAATGVSLAAVVEAYWVAREVSGAAALWDGLRASEPTIGAERHLRLKLDVDRMVAGLVHGRLADAAERDLAAVVARDGEHFRRLREAVVDLAPARRRGELRARVVALAAELGDEALAHGVATAEPLFSAADALALARRLDRAPTDALCAVLALREHLALERFHRLVSSAEAQGDWAAAQRRELAEDLDRVHRDAVTDALGERPDVLVGELLRDFAERRGRRLAAAHDVLSRAERDAGSLDAAAVAVRALARAIT